MKNKTFLLIIVIFFLAFFIRFLSVWPNNTVVGFDQARDFFDALKITQGHLKIIGPTAGNNPGLHHGVAWLYFISLPIYFGGGNPIWIVLWNSLFNALAAVMIFILAKALFSDKKVAVISAIVAIFSYYYVSYSGWLSNPTLTVLTVPIFFYGLWQYSKGKSWGLPLCFLFLGLTIQLELFFIYLIPTFIIAWLILRPKLPNLRTSAYCLFTLFLSLSTMIATEIKLRFAGIKSILTAGTFVGGKHGGFIDLITNFLEHKWEAFHLNFWPQYHNFGLILGVAATLYIIGETIFKHKNRGLVKRNLFLLLIFFSPIIMLLLGTHDAPWFLIGRPASVIIMGSYLISKIRPRLLIIPIVGLIIYANLLAIKNDYGKGQTILGPDNAAVLSQQIDVMDYTYKSSGGQMFAINTVTNPLYINAVWAWNYRWYSSKYGYLPGFAGGDQLPPYNVLPKASGQEKIIYLIIDQSPRIPPIYTVNAETWAKTKGKLVETKDFSGIKVEKYQTIF